MIANVFREALDQVIADRLRDAKQRQMVVSAVLEGFSRVAKKPVPDLEARVAKLQERVWSMSESVALRFVNGRLVIKVTGSSESLLNELRHGTDWYAPWEKVDETVVAAILVDPPK